MNVESGTDRPSKSARKREIAALQELAEQMAALSDGELQRLGVDGSLRREIQQVRSIRPSGARKRQLKHCVKYMQPEQLGEVRAYLADRHSQQVEANRRLHETERWRDRLAEQGDRALEELFARYPDLDRQHVRQLSREAARERETGKPAGAGRKLYRHLRESLFDAN